LTPDAAVAPVSTDVPEAAAVVVVEVDAGVEELAKPSPELGVLAANAPKLPGFGCEETDAVLLARKEPEMFAAADWKRLLPSAGPEKSDNPLKGFAPPLEELVEKEPNEELPASRRGAFAGGWLPLSASGAGRSIVSE